jgi:nitrite reductase/ring-hydroxylating ferredoxin subunit
LADAPRADAWVDVLSASELAAKRKAVVRVGGRQLLILQSDAGVAACPNRCPHEGYPLSEGDLSPAGTLRCNWHNWTFDLASGATLVGGDPLRRFPVKIENGRVWVAPLEPDRAERRAHVVAGLAAALDDADQQRLVRETARLMHAGADPVDAVRAGVAWIAERLPFGTTHAIAGMPDWLALADGPAWAPEQRLGALGEILGHVADDGHGEPARPLPRASRSWNARAFSSAIEAQDETAALEVLNGALAEGAALGDLLPAFARAALAHYAGFGHSVIYTAKSAQAIRRLGDDALGPLLRLLARSFVYATREDLLPEFRSYAVNLRAWGNAPNGTVEFDAAAPLGRSAKAAMQTVAGWAASAPPQAIFRALVDRAAATLLHVDERALTATDGSLADNVSWLDFTHALTFAESGERLAVQQPELWPAVLLQLACFIGRSAAYVDPAPPAAAPPPDPATFFAAATEELFDHGRDRFIISVHLIKTLFAARRLVDDGHADAALTAAALDRYLHARTKGRHVLRTARQMLVLVEGE